MSSNFRILQLEREVDRLSITVRMLETDVARLQFDNNRLREVLSLSESQGRHVAGRERALGIEVDQLRAENMRLRAGGRELIPGGW